MTGSRGILAAKHPLVVPMLLRLSHFKLNSYVVLVVSKQKGITLVFKTDPLQNVDINSTFDSIAVIQKFIQREIEGQLRQMFREDLPGIIHRLSQQWVKAKVEAPYLAKQPHPPRQLAETMSSPDLSYRAVPHVDLARNPSLSRGYARSVSGASVVSSNRRSAANPNPIPKKPSNPTIDTSDLDAETFDPTYGLRPEGIPMKSIFKGFSSLFTPNKGLADLAEESNEGTDFEEGTSTDSRDWDESIPPISPEPSEDSDRGDTGPEYETLPAVGGGTITRPRIYHSQSLSSHHPDEGISPSQPPFQASHSVSRSLEHILPLRSPTFARSPLSSSSIGPSHQTPSYNPYFPAIPTHYNYSGSNPDLHEPLYRRPSLSSWSDHPESVPRHDSFLRRPVTPDSQETDRSRSSSGLARSVVTPPSSDPAHEDSAIYMRRPPSVRRSSVSSTHSDAFHPDSLTSHNYEPNSKIVLRPTLNNSISQLSTLSHSNHTLSPYTHSLQHFTVRSVPPRGAGSSRLGLPTERQPLKAKRKRIYRLGGKPKDAPQNINGGIPKATSPAPPSEFEASDMDRYFRSREDLVPGLDIHSRRSLNSHQPP